MLKKRAQFKQPPLPAYGHCATSRLFYGLIPLKVTSQMYHFMTPQRNPQWLLGRGEKWKTGGKVKEKRIDSISLLAQGKEKKCNVPIVKTCLM